MNFCDLWNVVMIVLCLDHVTGGFLFDGMSDDDEDFQSVSLSSTNFTFYATF